MILRALFIWLVLATAAFAVEPGERLDDPVLEERARELSKGLRCLVCRNESIDESNAELARDLRILLRERIADGDSDEEAVNYLVSRFGEYVLLNPRATGANLILWVAGPVLLLAALAIAFFYVRKRRPDGPVDGLSEGEKERLAQLLEK
ncbi:MAG: cytochrome c-type biogenesis protein CcmH [Silicimonas sp.]|nr:cytochrome c-type biogenesis protein CcmH [Silicimonas sp.]